MGKSSRKKTTKRPKRLGKPELTQTKWQKVVEAGRRTPRLMIGVISFLIGLAGFVALVYPRISITPGTSLDLHNPYKTPFIIKNDGYLPLYDIEYDLIADKMELIDGATFTGCGGSTGNRIGKLSANKTSALFVNKIFSFQPDDVKYAKVTVGVTFKPWLIPFKLAEKVRFKTEINSNKEYIWFETYESM